MSELIKYIETEPKVITIEDIDYTIKFMSVTNILVKLEQEARTQYVLHDADKKVIKPGFIIVGGAEYAAWGDDDAYLEDQVLAFEGLTRI